MKIGYACLTRGVRDTSFRTCRLENANDENLRLIIKHNLNSLENIIDYNIENDIMLYRITSDLIPFGSHKVNKLKWWNEFREELDKIGEKISKHNLRVTMHPGQYTVLNSKNQDIVEKAVEDLKYHTNILQSLHTDSSSKIILHIGGVYGDKTMAMERFIENYYALDKSIKDRLVIENDDKSFSIEDVLEVSKKAIIPVVFDNLHNEVISSNEKKKPSEWIEECSKTWKIKDGTQKIHYSQQDIQKKPGGHSVTIDAEVFIDFVNTLNEDLDIMLEVKDKNLSAVKCINAIREDKNIKHLEIEWAKYKYLILERNQKTYNEIRQLLKDKDSYPVLDFYKLIDSALSLSESKKDTENAALHVWGYFKDKVSEKEKLKFMKSLDSYMRGSSTRNRFKKILWNLAKIYKSEYLLNSYYFIDIMN